ncbi:MAG: hypothetical protein IPL83_03960 [Bdellovibrionales bacterium]|nr:hypothetical protein [Bdellovibrionales bacterium]
MKEKAVFWGASGDLYVEIDVTEEESFRRQEEHLIGGLEISYLQALLSAEVNFPVCGRSEKVQIPRGTSSGDRIRLGGKGFPRFGGGRRGDLILEIEVKMPKKLGKKEEQLLREIAGSKRRVSV